MNLVTFSPCLIFILLSFQLEPWNVDTISSDGFSKTLINHPPARNNEELTEDEKEERMKEFVKKHEVNMKKYGMYKTFDDSRRFLMVGNLLGRSIKSSEYTFKTLASI